MTDLTGALIEMLSDVIDKGFEFPIFVVAISRNGCLTAVRYEWNTVKGATCHKIVEHKKEEQMELPINCFFVDKNGNSESTKIIE